ncbi:MAG: BON domain-containing protein [Acetobacteraceae bacterium]
MKSDSELKRDVEEELKWDPEVDPADVTIGIRSGVVSLNGFVKSYAQKREAEDAAKRIAGVAGVANDIEVRLPGLDERPDPDTAGDAVAAVRSRLPFSHDQVKVLVKSGWVTLEGTLEWQYQRLGAEDSVRWLKGVKGVTNSIQVKPRVQATEVKGKIEDAFRRHAQIDASGITVETDSDQVVLKGSVGSWKERTEAENAAWSAPGVRRVDDRLTVRL